MNWVDDFKNLGKASASDGTATNWANQFKSLGQATSNSEQTSWTDNFKNIGKAPIIPSDVKNAEAEQINPSENFAGQCQRFVEKVTTGRENIFPSAIDAWTQQQDKGVHGTAGLRPGDAIYFTPNQSNKNNGHTGIYLGNNQFISATDNGIMNHDLNEWQNLTGQQVLGYIPHTGGVQ